MPVICFFGHSFRETNLFPILAITDYSTLRLHTTQYPFNFSTLESTSCFVAKRTQSSLTEEEHNAKIQD